MLTLPPQKGLVHCLRFSPTDPILASAAGKGTTISLWSLQTQKRTLLRGAPKAVGEFQFSPDGQRLCAVSETAQLVCWEVATRSLQTIFPAARVYQVIRYPVRPYPASFTCQLDWEADGEGMIVSNLHPTQNERPWDPVHPDPCLRRFRFPKDAEETEEFLYPSPVSSVVGLNVLSEGKLLFRGFGRELTVFEPATQRIVKWFHADEENLDLRVSPTEDWVVGHYQDHATLWHWEEEKNSRIVPMNQQEVLRLEFTAAGDQFLTGGADGSVKRWDCSTGELVTAWDWELGQITALACSADGQLFAAGGENGIVIWDAE